LPGGKFQPGDLVSINWTEYLKSGSMSYVGPVIVLDMNLSSWAGWDYGDVLIPDVGIACVHVAHASLIQRHDASRRREDVPAR
jgi:hypothetical protein